MNYDNSWDPSTVTDDQFFDDFFEDSLDEPLELEVKPNSNLPPLKKKTKKNKKYWFVFFLAFSILFFNGYQMTHWFSDRVDTKKQITEILTDLETPSFDIASATTSASMASNNDYERFVDKSLNTVSFKELKKKNKDTVAWLKVNGTNINYPVVQSVNNDYYLNHSFNKKKNSAGWIYMDYRNSSTNLDKNTIIYGHSLWNKLMFGSLSKLIHPSHYQNKENQKIYLLTDNYQYEYKVFSVYTILEETYYLTTDFSKSNYKDFISTIYKRSKVSMPLPNKDKEIITLSTCYDEKRRLVVHAMLVNKVKR